MTRNIELLTKVRDAIANEDAHFNMGSWFTDDFVNHSKTACGTASCIAGWAIAIAKPKLTYLKVKSGVTNIYSIAKNALGLSEEDADWLFYGQFTHSILIEEITKDKAIKALNHLIDGKSIFNETGEEIQF